MSRATAQRHTQILTELLARKHVAVRSLATELSVSEATVRRDLRQLAERDELTLVHGGATLPRDADRITGVPPRGCRSTNTSVP